MVLRSIPDYTIPSGRRQSLFGTGLPSGAPRGPKAARSTRALGRVDPCRIRAAVIVLQYAAGAIGRSAGARGAMFGEREGRWPKWIERQLVRRGIRDERVLEAFARVPREAFVPRRFRLLAYEDGPLRIGCGQTISQPYVVALSLEAMALRGAEKVLDVGTGSGYQAALLSYLAREVYTIEVYLKLFTRARLTIEAHHQSPVYSRHGDGSLGWPEAAPFDAIVVGARAPKLPESLLAQLAVGGRLVIPIGGESAQVLCQIVKEPGGGARKRVLERVMYVPLVGEEGTGRLPE